MKFPRYIIAILAAAVLALTARAITINRSPIRAVSQAWAIAFDIVGNAIFPNGGTFPGIVEALTLVTTEVDSNHYVGTGKTPSVYAGEGAGTGAQIGIIGTDASGEILLTEGTAPVGYGIATVDFAVAYLQTPHAVILTPANVQTAALYGPQTAFVANEAGLEIITTEGFIVMTAGAQLVPGTQYKWHYEVK